MPESPTSVRLPKKIAVLGPIPRDRIITYRGDVLHNRVPGSVRVRPIRFGG